MFRILSKRELAEKIKEYVVEAPMIALKAKPGNFVLVRTDERAERIPLTIADSDAQAGTVTMVVQEIGRGTLKLGELSEGDTILDIVGPLGKDREMPSGNETVVCVSGGLGVAPMYPQTKACHENGCKVISIIGSRSKSLFFWQDRIEAISDEVMYSTDDGSFGHHGFATQLLEQVIARGEPISEVIAIGPVPHMRAVVNTCKKHNVPCVVSLNPIMVDGTGMCGGCRVTVAGETKYACVDGPEFDGLEVDFAELMARQGAYRSEEQRPVEPEEECRLEKQVAEMEAAKAGDGAHHRPTTFNEVARVYTEEEALAAAGRCLVCKKPQCITGCPVEVDIPGFIKAVQDKDFRGSAAIRKDKHILPAICSRVCPLDNQCEKTCVLGRKSTTVTI